MPVYAYIAQNDAGKRVRSTATAADQQELHQRLREKGLYLISAEEEKPSASRRRIKARDLSEFNRQVGELVASGIPLVRALTIICQQETLKPWEADAYKELLKYVRQGVPMSNAMEEMGNVFPPLMINMYRSAEEAGNLDVVAKRMAIHYDKEWRLNSKVKSATTYPKLLGVLIVAVVVIIMSYVLPQFSAMFATMESLPALTEALMAISGFVSAHWAWLLAAIVAAVLIVRGVLSIPSARLTFDKLKVHIPVIGRLLKIIYTARFARTLSSLYSSGIPLSTGLEVARHTTGNTYIDSQFGDVITRVRSGDNLSEALSVVDGFIKKLEFSVRVGEETGSLDSMLESTADALDYESEMALGRMVGFLEPALIIVMALIVGFIMLAVIVPIYSSYSTIGAGY